MGKFYGCLADDLPVPLDVEVGLQAYGYDTAAMTDRFEDHYNERAPLRDEDDDGE